MLFEGSVLVLEFKRKDVSLIQDVDQLRGYLNFLRRYHEQTERMGLDVRGSLILTTNNENIVQPSDGYHPVKGKALLHLLGILILEVELDQTRALSWANFHMNLQKNVLKATYNMFMKDDLSMIKNISEHELRNVLKVLHELTAEPHNKNRLIF